jgi:DNA-binding MarR family transcriptional regulator
MNGCDPCRPGAADGLLNVLLRTSGHVHDRLERAVEPLGLSLAKLSALERLSAAGGSLALGQLADHLACVKSNVTQLVDRLEADGLVRRQPDPGDRRSVLAVLTDEGRERLEAALQAQSGAEAEVLSTLAPGEQEQLFALLQQLGGAAAVR